jgi:hypothetical protein
VLGKSGLLAVSDSCWLNNLQLPTTETDRACRISTSSPCSSNSCGSCTYSSIQQNPISGVETRRPAKWPGKVNLESLFPSKRLHSRGRWSVGTARAGKLCLISFVCCFCSFILSVATPLGSAFSEYLNLHLNEVNYRWELEKQVSFNCGMGFLSIVFLLLVWHWLEN